MRAACHAGNRLMQRPATLGSLRGMPFSTNDLVRTKGVRTTFDRPRFADHVLDEDSLMVARLKAAGAVHLGKTNTPTFGWLEVVRPHPVRLHSTNPSDLSN